MNSIIPAYRGLLSPRCPGGRPAASACFPNLDCRFPLAASEFPITTIRPRGRILKEPPFVCIEILSPEDRASRVETKIDEYLAFGIPYVWLIDPRSRKAWAYTKTGRHDATEVLDTTNPSIQLFLTELFNQMDEAVDLSDE